MYDIRNMDIWKKEETGRSEDSWRGAEITELNLSVRSFNCLKRAGCNTVGDLMDLITEDENGLRRIRNLGSRSETEILENLQQFREEHRGAAPAGNGSGQKRLLIRPARRVWDASIEEFPLSAYARSCLARSGIRQVKDLYGTDPANEPGWYAVRELFEKIASR